MGEAIYYGSYERFEVPSKKDASVLLSSDSLIGDFFNIVFVTEEGRSVAWVQNKFGAKVGFFDEQVSRQLNLCAARNWTLNALLSFVAFTEAPEPGRYWGQMALICYSPREAEAFELFMEGISKRMAEGLRPEVDLRDKGVQQVIESKGAWSPSQYAAKPDKRAGTVIIKSRRSVTDKAVEQARKGNKGCYVVGWAFILIIIALILFTLKSCGVF